MEHRGVLSAKNHHGQMSESFLTAGLLSLSGGLQDAYTYLARGEVFANAQTGNIVLMSVRLFEGAPHRLFPGGAGSGTAAPAL